VTPGPDPASRSGSTRLDPADDQLVGRRDLRVWPTAAGRLLASTARRVAAFTGSNLLLASTLVLGGLLLVLMTAATAEIYESVVEQDGAAALDKPVLAAAQRLRTPAADTAITLFTDLGSAQVLPWLVAVVTIALALRWRQWTPVVLMSAAVTGSVLMTVAGKSAVGRTRPALVDAVPPYESSASFPSGHSLNAVVVAGVLAYLIIRRQRTARGRLVTLVLAATFAVAMGLSRVYLGHHWFTDVLVAWTLGLAWLTVVVVAHRLFLTVRHRGPAGTDGST
jgi:membrane-associated phospholipid phosphatase